LLTGCGSAAESGDISSRPSFFLSFADVRSACPKAAVLNRSTGFDRPYGSNPYAGYDSLERPFLYQGPETDTPAGMMEQVLAVKAGGETRAVSYTVLREEGVVQFILGGRSIVVFWKEGTASALDSRTISLGRDTGSRLVPAEAVQHFRFSYNVFSGK
jgi:hypothetical protein